MLDIDRLRAAMQSAGRKVTFVHYVENNLENNGWRTLSVHYQELTSNEVYEANFNGDELNGPNFEAQLYALERHGSHYGPEEVTAILAEMGFFVGEVVDAVPVPEEVESEAEVVDEPAPRPKPRRKRAT